MSKEPTDLFNQPREPIKAADQKAKYSSLNEYRRQRDKLINEMYYGGNGIPGQPVYED